MARVVEQPDLLAAEIRAFFPPYDDRWLVSFFDRPHKARSSVLSDPRAEVDAGFEPRKEGQLIPRVRELQSHRALLPHWSRSEALHHHRATF
jgi:hypothetical protein